MFLVSLLNGSKVCVLSQHSTPGRARPARGGARRWATRRRGRGAQAAWSSYQGARSSIATRGRQVPPTARAHAHSKYKQHCFWWPERTQERSCARRAASRFPRALSPGRRWLACAGANTQNSKLPTSAPPPSMPTDAPPARPPMPSSAAPSVASKAPAGAEPPNARERTCAESSLGTRVWRGRSDEGILPKVRVRLTRKPVARRPWVAAGSGTPGGPCVGASGDAEHAATDSGAIDSDVFRAHRGPDSGRARAAR